MSVSAAILEIFSGRNFVNMFDARKTGMIVLPYGGKNYDDTLSRFHTIPACHGQTDGLAIASVERAYRVGNCSDCDCLHFCN